MNRPVTAVPAATRSSERVRRLIVNTILIVGTVAALAGIFAAVAWLRYDPQIPTRADLTPVATGAAYTVAQDFLLGVDTRVPTAEGVGGDFSEREAPLPFGTVSPLRVATESLTDSSGRTQHYEIHSYLVGINIPADEEDEPDEVAMHTLDVPMLLTPNGPVLAASPSLGPYIGARGSSAGLDYRHFASDEALPRRAREAIDAWANAYVTNDATGLRNVTGDDIHEDDYVGLRGFRLTGGPSLGTVIEIEPGRNLVQVEVLVSPARANGGDSTLTFDLLVEGTASQSPRVTAWGPAGSAQWLQPYENNPGYRD